MSLTLCILIRFWNNAWSKTLTFSDKSPGVFCLSAHDTTALVFMYTTHIYHVIQQWHRNEPLSTLQLSVNSHYSLHVTLQQKKQQQWDMYIISRHYITPQYCSLPPQDSTKLSNNKAYHLWLVYRRPVKRNAEWHCKNDDWKLRPCLKWYSMSQKITVWGRIQMIYNCNWIRVSFL